LTVSYTVEVVVSAVSMRIHSDSVAAVAVDGIATDCPRFSDDVLPLPCSQAL
jgi:hypothetical protein